MTCHLQQKLWCAGINLLHSIFNLACVGMRPEVEIYEDGSRCKVDGIWYKPNDPVVVLDAALGQYHAKYLFLANDEVITRGVTPLCSRIHSEIYGNLNMDSNLLFTFCLPLTDNAAEDGRDKDETA